MDLSEETEAEDTKWLTALGVDDFESYVADRILHKTPAAQPENYAFS